MEKGIFLDILNYKIPNDDQSTAKLKSVAEEFPYFSVAQILYLKNLKETSHPDFEMVLKKIAVSVPNRKKLFQFLNTQQEIVSDPKNISEQESQFMFNLKSDEQFESKNSLIDKFLSSDIGRISREPDEDSGAQEIEYEVIKKSSEEDDEIVTETLASIYLQQKKYDKALNAFRKLSLKYPEKNIYFASRIKEIEELKNI